jgi:predicted Zn finger-like uncharacterized protein
MKIACQSCQAKYTIADDKVLGRVVKIRCKKCGATIVINGNDAAGAGAATEEAQAAPNSRAFDYAAQQNEEPWTVNVTDGDQRTLTTAEVVAQFKAGVVNDETYCWKDGMGDWLPLREIDSLAAACGMGGLALAPEPSRAPVQPAYTAPAPAAAMGGGGGGLGALFGGGDTNAYGSPAVDANGRGGPHGAPAAARRAGGRAGAADLFGAAAEAGGENDVMTSAPQGAPAMHDADAKLTGQRNENSVLFSLNALTANAPKKEETPGPQGDGSGLIDIRALSAHMAPQTKKANHVDDIMNLGGGGAFSAALAAPVLAPPLSDGGDSYYGGGSAAGKSNKMMYVVIGLGALIAVLLVVVLLRPKGDATTTSPSASGATPAGSAAPVASGEPSTAAAAPAASDTSQAVAPGGAAGAAAAVDPTKNNAASTTAPATPHHPSGGGAAATPAATAAVPAIPAAPAAAPNFEDALKKAGGGGGGGPPPAAVSGGSAPFDRGAAAGALGAVNVAGCKRPDGPTGSGHVAVTFAPDGSVSSAVVDQAPFAGTPVGGCVAGKFRGAHIPSFAGGPVKVGKSFTIN